jgi:hypothetical protein
MFHYVNDEECDESRFIDLLFMAIAQNEEDNVTFEEMLDDQFAPCEMYGEAYWPSAILYYLDPSVYQEKEHEFIQNITDQIYMNLTHGEEYNIDGTQFNIYKTQINTDEINLYDDED